MVSLKDLIRQISKLVERKNVGTETEPFIIEAVTYVDVEKMNIDSLDGQNSLRKYLYENDRAFIWDNMISPDQNVKDVLKDAIDKNKLVA